MALPKTYEVDGAVRRGVEHRRPRGRDRRDRRRARRRARAADRGGPPAAAGVLGGQGRRAGAPTRSPAPARRSSWPSARSRSTASRSSGATGTGAAFVIECSSGTYVRSLIADLGDAYCERCGARGSGRSTSPTPIPSGSFALDEALELPARGAARGRGRAAGGHGGAVAGDAAGATVRLTDDEGLIALAEPDAGATASSSRSSASAAEVRKGRLGWAGSQSPPSEARPLRNDQHEPTVLHLLHDRRIAGLVRDEPNPPEDRRVGGQALESAEHTRAAGAAD